MAEDSFLLGNDRIEKVIHLFYEAQTPEHLLAVCLAIRERIAENGHLIFPAVINETDCGETTFAFKTLVWNGVNALATFTSQTEKEKGPESAAVSQFIDTMLDALMQMDGIEGLIINPWGEVMFLDKDDITVILNPGIERFI